jgi:Na+/H+ antiporter NhaC
MSDIDAEIERLNDEINTFLGNREGDFERAIETAAEKERKQNSNVRSAIAIIIILTYATAILISLAYLFLRFPECKDVAAEICTVQQTGWDAQAETLSSLLTGAVLPVVTLMLGFYFGTETAKKDDG